MYTEIIVLCLTYYCRWLISHADIDYVYFQCKNVRNNCTLQQSFLNKQHLFRHHDWFSSLTIPYLLNSCYAIET